MPFQIMDQRGVSASSHFFDDISFRSERNVGLQKPKSINDHYPQGNNGMVASPGSILNATPPLDVNAKVGLLVPQASLPEDSIHSTESSNCRPKSLSDACLQSAPTSYGLIGNKIVTNAAPCESSLFSSSMSEIFSQKLRLFGNDVRSDHLINADSPPEEEPYKSLEEMEADTIGNLLPDEDDLFSGVVDELGCSSHARTNDDFEDFDLFSSGGGMEMEGDEHLSSGKRISALDGDFGFFGGYKGKLPFVEQPSRTLFVRNINSNVDDSELKALFEQYGDIRTIYTASKHRGFVMISYQDLRAAQNAMQELQNRPLRSRKLDIHYSIPKVNAPEKDIGHGTLMLSGLDSPVLDDELKQIFGFYGEIKEIYEYPEMNNHKFIEFYDVRAAEAALRALNKIDISGKQIKLEPGHPSLMHQSRKGQEERDLGQSIIDNLSSRQKATVPSGVIGSGCFENGYNQRFQSTVRQPLNAFMDNAFIHVNSGIHNTVRGAPAGKVSSVCAGATEASDGRHIQGMGSTGNLAEFNAGGNGIRPHHGLYHMWNSSNLQQQTSSSTMLWQKSPSFVNDASSPGLPQMSSFARTPPHMLRTPHMMDHHVGSAPVVTASPWERKNSYLGGSPEASGFRLGSLGSGGFHGSWQMHPLDFPSHNMFSHVGGNGTELTSNAGQNSPKQLSHVFPVRHPMSSMSKFDASNERMRNLYHRRNEANTNNVDKKLYELDLGRILRGEDSRTTLMIKNIPNKYTSKMLLAAIDEQCKGTYDFLYLPIDFKNKCNVGYAFINMIDPGQIIPFHQAFDGKKWEKFNSEKVASLAYARIQGKASLIAHFQNSSLMNEDKRCRPILFHTDGPNAGDPEPFPMGANIRLRPGKSRTAGNEENRSQGSPSTLSSGEDANGIDSSKNT
ncbi:Protein MEI2-like 4 isoform G [Glycine soja]|uniref:Protein MEI2-like 4 isoform G n=1 Tax=Glycine soja TaxID=3848 RepID=A0A445KRF1_GLYSO|nr:Protein MEI2-like 4 isoform G [Glycine soja]